MPHYHSPQQLDTAVFSHTQQLAGHAARIRHLEDELHTTCRLNRRLARKVRQLEALTAHMGAQLAERLARIEAWHPSHP